MAQQNEQKKIYKEQLQNRLKRIEGQVRGIHNMVENDRYCIDILVQVSAIQAAIDKVGLQLLENHTHHCIAEALKAGNETEAIAELMDVVKRFKRI